MNSKKMLVPVMAIVSVCLAALGFAFLLIAALTEYDVSIGHFENKAIFATLAYAVCIIGVIAAAVCAFLVRGNRISRGKNAGIFLSFTSALSAILMLACVVLTFVDNIIAQEAAIPGTAMNMGMVHYLSMLTGVLGGAALVLFVFYGSYRTNISQILSFCIPVYFVFETLIQYFDKTTAINSPLKILVQLAFVSYAVFTTFDAGVYIGKEKILPRYVFSCMAAVVIGGSVSLATLVCQFVSPQSFGISVVESCLACSLFLLAAAKLHHIAFSIKPEKKEEPAVQTEQAEETVNE
ncbi:MAG: hypothetical protein IKL36_03640 [Clostridia bacterium]|nr:hypothetical protein [Clostridia bacterium]